MGQCGREQRLVWQDFRRYSVFCLLHADGSQNPRIVGGSAERKPDPLFISFHVVKKVQEPEYRALPDSGCCQQRRHQVTMLMVVRRGLGLPDGAV